MVSIVTNRRDDFEYKNASNNNNVISWKIITSTIVGQDRLPDISRLGALQL
jgi:hypothetical protein